MPDEKIDPQLNLSLDLPGSERSAELFFGYDPYENLWEIVINYNGNLADAIAGIDGIENTAQLSGGFAVMLVHGDAIRQLAGKPEIIYIDTPKALYFTVENGIQSSCVTQAWQPPFSLSGSGTIACIIDSGIDYSHPDFLFPDGSSRILAIWDQTIPSGTVPSYTGEGFLSSPTGYFPGTLFPQEQINAALGITNKPQTERPHPELCPSIDISGHGTHVAGICAGNGEGAIRYRGCAYEADLLIVKLGRSVNSSYPTTTQLMQAADWAIQFAIQQNKPIAINLSFGNNYGAHDGTSLLEQFLNRLSQVWKCMIVAGTGNECSSGIHYHAKLPLTGRNSTLLSCPNSSPGSAQTAATTGRQESACPVAQLSIASYETSLSIQIWKQYYDKFEITIIPPSGTSQYRIPMLPGTQSTILGGVRLDVYYGEPSPFQEKQEIYIEMKPTQEYLTSGVWRIYLSPRRILNGNVHMWLPSHSVTSNDTRFLNASEEMTFTIPSTAANVLSVAAYDQQTLGVAPFSGRGYTAISGQGRIFYKPELAAPGVNISSAAPGGGYTIKSGTSMATPFVSGISLLCMQWGIVQGNDPFLYGEKLKDFLISGSQTLPSFPDYPNSQIGYGSVCAYRSLPNP